MNTPVKPSDGVGDPFLWLEEIEGERAVAWVAAENERTETFLQDAAYRADYEAALAILNSNDKIPFVGKAGEQLYNFWKDAKNPRGLWRRTTLESYTRPAPDWDVLLDIDALGASEGVAWAFGGATLSPDRTRALVSLSFNGTDAVEIREFDLAAKQFVAGGFVVPKAKGSAAWLDADTLLINSALTAENTTDSGYGRTVRKWQRGTPVDHADIVFSVEKSDMGAWFDVNHRPGCERIMYWRSLDFTRSEIFVEPNGGQRVKLALPDEVSTSVSGRDLTVSPKQDWRVGELTIPAGGLASIDLDHFLTGSRDFEIVFAPSPTRALESWIETRHGLVLQVLDNVRTRLLLATRTGKTWVTTEISGLPANASIYAGNFGGERDPELGKDVLLTITAFEQPTSLALWNGTSPQLLKKSPETFDASGIEVRQFHATADDGEKIPYFLIGKDLAAGGPPRPTILYGYGGFEISLTPNYMNLTGKLWLERGYLYAMANIRGGGEFGPRWHEAARRKTKHVAHDDFAAIAKHLATSGVTTARQLACHGASNGGLLVGNMLTRYGDLFGAIWCGVPLLDMARYTKLLAGHSWIAEYGDPDDPAEWDFIRHYSPYHLIAEDKSYPPILITTNRTDDRVHPGHARKMMARLKALGGAAWFHENVAGGHSGAVDNTKQAASQALGFAFLRRTIAGEPPSS
jgi:prolyl oligopeptidase